MVVMIVFTVGQKCNGYIAKYYGYVIFAEKPKTSRKWLV